MRATHRISVLAVVTLLGSQVLAQEPPNKPSAASPETAGRQWSFSFTADGYVVPQDQSYISPTFTADHQWLHLEARYNYEDLETGSLWVGYNFSAGHKLMLNVTPMIGGVFGKTTGVAPGDEVSLSFKKLELSSQGEYVFDTKDSSGSFSTPGRNLLIRRSTGLTSAWRRNEQRRTTHSLTFNEGYWSASRTRRCISRPMYTT